MPITPFHFGPGLLLKAALPRQISLASFVLTQVIIDLEPLLRILADQWPLHHLLHTPPGATLAVLLAIWPGQPGLAWLRQQWNQRQPPDSPWQVRAPMTWSAVAWGAAAGAYSHLVLDAVMHVDVQLFAPWSQANPLQGLVSMETLYGGCLVAGLVGGLLCWYRCRLRG